MSRSLFRQLEQIRGTYTFFDDMYRQLSEQTGRHYDTGTVAVTSGSADIVDSSTAFGDEEKNNFIVIDSGAAAGVYKITATAGTTATVTPTPTGTDGTASARRHYYQNLEDDLNYIRYQLDAIIGEDNWYDEPNTDLKKIREIFDDTNEPTGFVDYSDHSSIAIDDGTDTFTISGTTNDQFSYYVDGIKYTKTGADSVASDTTEGLHFFYYDGETLSHTTTWTDDIITHYAFIAATYYDSTNSTTIYLGEERHGISMDGPTHQYLHNKFGTTFVSGLALSNFTADDDGSADAHAQFGSTAGKIQDEDISIDVGANTFPAQLPVFYKDGASGNWRTETSASGSFSVLNFSGGDGLLAWNEYTGSAWTQTEVSNGDFVLAHVFATNDADNGVISIQGQAEYNSLIEARLGAVQEISNLVTAGMPFAEFVPIGTIIFQTSNTFTNAIKAIVRTTDEDDDYVDWRYSQLSPSIGSVNDHGNLTGLTDQDHPASAIYTDFATFSGILSSVDDDVQKALQTIDQYPFNQFSHTHYEFDLAYQSGSLWMTSGASLSSIPTALEVHLNGLKNKGSDPEYYVATVSGGELKITFAYDTYSEDWVNAVYLKNYGE